MVLIRRQVGWEPNWTQDASGRENSSDLFCSLVPEVARLIRGDASALLAGRAESTARLVLSHLAHVHGLSPLVNTQRDELADHT